MTGQPLVAFETVTAGYGHHAVLTDVDMTVGPDSFIGIVGPSGAGKTTLLRLILGTVRPRAGQVRLRRGVTVSYVPQLETVNWDFPVTVAECVLMGRTRGRRLPWASRQERADIEDLLGRLGISELAGRHIRELSGGQQQRMFLARALLRRPHLLLLDEPTSGVDVTTRHDVLHLLDSLNAEGVAVVLTTHDLNGIAAHLPTLVCVRGRIIAAGPPRAVITAPVLEETYGAKMEVLEHLSMPVVVDNHLSMARRAVAG